MVGGMFGRLKTVFMSYNGSNYTDFEVTRISLFSPCLAVVGLRILSRMRCTRSRFAMAGGWRRWRCCKREVWDKVGCPANQVS